jgi:hypothetical protein
MSKSYGKIACSMCDSTHWVWYPTPINGSEEEQKRCISVARCEYCIFGITEKTNG